MKDYEVKMEINQKSILQIQEVLAECRNSMDSIFYPTKINVRRYVYYSDLFYIKCELL